MKKIQVLLIFLFSAVVSFAYEKTDTFPNRQSASNAQTLFTYRGGLTAGVGYIQTNYPDTASANLTPLKDNSGAEIFVSDTLWVRDITKTRWIPVQAGGIVINDTIYTRLPIYVDYTSNPPKRIISFLQANGVLSGGVVSLDSCMTIDVSPVIYYFNYEQFTIAQTLGLVVATPHATLDRIDAVIVDTFGIVSILTGTPSATPIAPQVNPSSQLILTTITVPGGATCLAIGADVIYDENTGAPEWTPTTSGTVSADEDNTDNPFHLTKADYVVTYTDGSQLIFTETGVADTVKGGDVFKFYITVIGDFTNQIQAQWYNGATAVSTPLVLNPYFNVNDSNQYQLVVVPFSAWSFPGGNVYNKLIITFAGNDVSGSKGVYFDWIQVQTGLTNTEEPPPPAWLISGNDNTTPPVNFLGTTNNRGLMFKVNNVQSGYLDLNFNTSFGRFSAANITSGFSNVALGYAALFSNTSGNHNIGVGYKTLNFNTTGFRNTGIGYEALYNNTTGSYNIGLGYQFDDPNTTRSNTLSISDSTTKMYMRIDTATGTAPSVIGYNPVTKMWNHYVTPTGGGGGLTTADNGLTANTATNVRLGGTLLATTTISGNAFSLKVLGTVTSPAAQMEIVNSGTGGGLNINSDGGVGLEVVANTGYGASISSSTGPGLQIGAGTNTPVILTASPATTNTITTLIDMARYSSGTPANGIGGSILYNIETATGGAARQSNTLESKWTTATDATRTSQFDITGVNSAVIQTQLSLLGTGQLQLPQYITANFNGGVAADSVLVVTSTGIVKKRNTASFGSGGGGGGNNIYNIDSSLSSDRTVDLNGKILKFSEGGQDFLVLNPVGFSSTIRSTDGTAVSGLSLTADVGNEATFALSSNDGTNEVKIEGDAIANTITHTADTHTFNGSVFATTIDGNNTGSFSLQPIVSAITLTNDSVNVNFTAFSNGAMASSFLSLSSQFNDGGTQHGMVFKIEPNLITLGSDITPGGNIALITISELGLINLANGLQNFASNAAAISGGLVAGDLYRNGDNVAIVH